MDKKFEVQSILKNGSYAVYKVKRKDKICGVYKIPLKHATIKALNLLSIKHKNIVSTYELVSKYILMEYADCGSLENYLHGQREINCHYMVRVLNWALQIAEGLEYLHSSRTLICVNLNPKRMLLFNNFTCLKINIISLVINSGVNKYSAPEALTMTNCFESCDIYSFGIVFWELLTLKKPFYNIEGSTDEFKSYILDGLRPCLSDVHLTDQNVLDLIKSCWDSNPEKRPKQLTKDIRILLDFYTKHPPEYNTPGLLEIQDIVDEEVCLGKGSYGAVYKATWKSQCIAVNKIGFIPFKLFGETCHKPILHKNIIRIYEIVPKESFIYVLMEYAECGDLFDFLHDEEQREYSVELALNWMHQTAVALKYLYSTEKRDHFLGCILSSKKLMFFSNFTHIKFRVYHSDFCSVKANRIPRANVPYMDSLDKVYTEEATVFSFGIVLWEVMSRKKPYYDLNHFTDFEFKHKMEAGERPLLNDIRISKYDFIEKLITSCWNKNSAERLKITDLPDMLRDFEILNEQLSLQKNPETLTVDFLEINLLKAVGSGSFGIVYQAEWRERIIAVKAFTVITECKLRAFEKEVRQLSRANHENIIQFYGTSVEKETAYLLMEYAECGSLHAYIHGDEDNKRIYSMVDGIKLLHQCLMGITYLHKMTPKPMVHRDLKPHNLFLSNNFKHLRIGDFGTVTDLTSNMTTNRGTPAYIAPEVYQERYTEKCDIFSFGVIIWEVMTRKRPFCHLEDPVAIMFNSAVLGVRPALTDIKITDCEMLHKIIENCWHQEPDNRPKAKDINLDEIPLLNFFIV